MIVEPASIHSRSPLRRLLRAAAFVVPVALLVVVLGAGLLGPKPAQNAGADASASALAVVSPSAAPAASPSGAVPVPTPAVAAADVAFPASVALLDTVRPSQVLAERASLAGAPGVYAVRGFLALTGGPAACAAPMITYGAWCSRTGTLFESARAGGLDANGGRPPHLHVVIPPGVVLPNAVTAGGEGAAGSVPVVAVGRFETPGSCGANAQACDQGFVVERVVWANGLDAGLQPLREPGQSVRAVDPSRPPNDQASIVLLAVLARPTTVARIDPSAGDTAARTKGLPKVVWYVRVATGLDTAPEVHWALLDPRTGHQLATGVSALPPLAAAVPGSAPTAPPG